MAILHKMAKCVFSSLEHKILRGMRKLKHVTVEDPSYFFRRKSDPTANRITPVNFFYICDLVCQ